MRNIFFAINLISCMFLLVVVLMFPSILGVALSDSLGITIHMAVMAIIFLSAFAVAVSHQLYHQEKIGRW